MKTPNTEVEALLDAAVNDAGFNDAAFIDAAFINALRRDLPTAGDEARVRARLLAAGMLLTGTAASTSSAAAASGSTVAAGVGPIAGAGGVGAASVVGTSAGAGLGAVTGAGVPAAIVKVGLLSKILVLPVAAKMGAATLLAVAVAATSVPLVLDRGEVGRGEVARGEVARGEVQPSGPRSPRSSATASENALQRAARIATPSPEAASDLPAGPGTVRVETAGPAASTPAAVPSAAVPLAAAPRAPVATIREASTPEASARVGATARTRRRAVPAGAASERTSSERTSSEHGTQRVRVSTLGEETRLVERAMLAMGDGDRVLARSYLDEHARRFPTGLLQRERERALTRLSERGAE